MFAKGQKVRGIDLQDGCPIKGGEVYTVRRYGTYQQVRRAAPEIIPPGNPRCVIVEEHPGATFMETRFEAIQ